MVSNIRKYWRSAKERFSILSVMTNVLKSIIFTDSAFWLARNLDEELPKLDSKIPIEINIPTELETIDYIKCFKQRWMNNPKEIELGLRENHFYSNAKYNGKIVACSKTAINKVYIGDYDEEITLPPTVAFNYHMYVDHEYHGNNIAGALTVRQMYELKKRGYKIIGGYFSPWNIASRNYCRKVGFKKIMYIRNFRVFGIIKFWFVNNLITGNKRLVFKVSKLSIY